MGKWKLGHCLMLPKESKCMHNWPSEELDYIKVQLSRTLLEFDRILDIQTENILSFRVVMKKSETMGD